MPLLCLLEVPIYLPAIIIYSGIIYAAMKTFVSRWSHPVILKTVFDMKMPFVDNAFDLSVNLMILEILFLIAMIGVSGLCHAILYAIKEDRGIRWGIRGTLNINRAEELPAPYYERNDGKYCKFSFSFEVSQILYNFHLSDVNIAKNILQVFALVFTGTLTIVVTCLSIWITEDTFATNSTEWWTVLICLYLSVAPWILTFSVCGFCCCIFVRMIRGTLFWE